MSVIGSAPAVCLLHLTLVVGKPNQSSYCHLVVAVSCLMKLKKKKHFCCWLRGIITTGIKTRTRILSVQITMEARRGGVDSIHVKTCCCCWCAQQISVGITVCVSSLCAVGQVCPMTAYDKNGIRVLLHFASNCPAGRPDVLVMVATTLNTAPLPVRNIMLQAAVPKVKPTVLLWYHCSCGIC